MSAASAGSAAPAAPSPFFVNGPVDFLLIGGASLVTFVLMRLFHDGTRTQTIINLGIWLSWVVNWPHFSATSYRLYAHRDHVRQYPVTAIAAPLVVAAGVAGSFLSPKLIAPYFVMLFMIWSPYHFSGQTLGISLLYARRGQHKVIALERFVLSGFIYGTFLIGTLRAQTVISNYQFYGLEYPALGIPSWVVTAGMAWTGTCGVVFLGLLAWRSIAARKWPPLMYVLPAATQYVWFVPGSRPGFAEFVPMFHSLQYLLIAWAMQLKEESDREGTPGTASFVMGESARWYLLNVAGGVALFWALPELAVRAGIPPMVSYAVLISAVQIHHFFVDGVIWKLKTASVVSPLLVNVPRMVRAAELAAPERVAA